MGIHTLHIEHVVLLAVYTLLTVSNSLMYRGMKGIHWFSLYNLFALLGAIAVAMRGQIPDFLSIVLGNVCVVIGYSLLFLSLGALCGFKKKHFYFQGALIAIAVMTMLQYGWAAPDTKLRLLAYSLVLCLQQAQIGWYIYRAKPGGLRFAGGPMALIMAALSLTNLVRIFGVSLHGAPANYLNAGEFLGWIVIINSCLQCGAMVAYVWLTAALLRSDLEMHASTDPLTGLLNRRSFEQRAEQEIRMCLKLRAPISAVMIDLDGFKLVNGAYGHSGGDAMLMSVANCLSQNVRGTDLIVRLGGDEFAVLLPQTSMQAATDIAEELRSLLANLKVQLGSSEARITASFGLAEVNSRTVNWDVLSAHCDHALYAAKRMGGNQVTQ